tara:strand:+ start:196 stop:870 length:675 start_codon:yes stop_codon:yes gene_type:complete
LIIYLLILFLYLSPIIWFNFVFKKNDKILENMPFNGLEFGRLILKEKGLSDVTIESTMEGDHYDPNEKKVRVKQDRLDNKSITAISVVCHEIGHAIQHNENYKPLERRQILVKNTAWVSKLGGAILYIGLPMLFATGSFPIIRGVLILVLLTIITSVLIHLITLDVEIDASFNKALPILRDKIDSHYHEECRSVLRAAAYTYVIGSLQSFISLRYIWLLIMRLR